MHELQKKLAQAFPNAKEIRLEGEGCNLQVTILSPEFEGLSTLARQRQVNAVLKEELESGAIHALTIKALSR